MNIGSEIKFRPAHQGTEKGKEYKWIASTRPTEPEVTYIREHPVWHGDEDIIIRKLIKIFSHEPIHQILWRDDLEAGTDYDIGRDLFLTMLAKDLIPNEVADIGINM